LIRKLGSHFFIAGVNNQIAGSLEQSRSDDAEDEMKPAQNNHLIRGGAPPRKEKCAAIGKREHE